MSISNKGIMQLNSPLQHKHGTSKALEASDYVLAAGEIITATDTGEIRAGNGTDVWKDLPSIKAVADSVSNLMVEGTNTEIHILTDEEVIAKAFSLNSAVVEGKESQIMLFVCGVAQVAGIDFTASGSTISWEDKGLDDVELKTGDVFIIRYNTIMDKRDTPNLSLDTDLVKATINGSTTKVTVVASYDGEGVLSATSNDTSIATVSVSNKTITVTGVARGSTTLSVSVAETAKYKAETSIIDVEVSISNILEDNSWDIIAEIGAAGTGATYWDVGDTKTVTLNGTVGILNLSNYTAKVFIIDFNYRNEKGVYFQGFKTMDEKDIALCDSYYNKDKTYGNNVFSMSKISGLNDGSWIDRYLRYVVLGSTSVMRQNATTTAKTNPVSNTLMAALPADLRAVLSLWTVYTSNAVGNIIASKDYLVLLSEYEVYGSRSKANISEASYQSQMAYYEQGNSKIKYSHSSTEKSVYWWLRSPSREYDSHFCCGYDWTQIVTDASADYSYGIAPAFKVGK